MVTSAAANDMPYVFAMLQDSSIVHLHWPQCYPTTLLNPPNWAGKVCGFNGDVDSHNNINFFTWPRQPFGHTQVRHPVDAVVMTAAWATAGNAALLDILPPNAEDTTLAYHQHQMPVPTWLVPFALATGSFTPKEYWNNLIVPQILNDLATAEQFKVFVELSDLYFNRVAPPTVNTMAVLAPVISGAAITNPAATSRLGQLPAIPEAPSTPCATGMHQQNSLAHRDLAEHYTRADTPRLAGLIGTNRQAQPPPQMDDNQMDLCLGWQLHLVCMTNCS